MRINFRRGAYKAQSPIAASERCVNLYLEKNPPGSLTEFTHYTRPGLRPLVQDATNPTAVRGLYTATNGYTYAVIGSRFYLLDQNWVLSLKGGLAVGGTTPVSMTDNGHTLMLVDGVSGGYTYSLTDGSFAQIYDPTGTFTQATKVDILDTFILWNIPGTGQFGSTLSNEVSFDALYIAAKSAYPDKLQTLYVNRRYLLLLGQYKTELWYDAGNANFPFAEFPGLFFEQGCAAPWSASSFDVGVYWLGQSLQGTGMVFRARGQEVQRVSNHALEWAIRQMIQAGVDISDAVGFCYQINGHPFYKLTFQAGNQTWVFDEASGEWHQEGWVDPTDGTNAIQRSRDFCHAMAYGKNVAGDWENGWIYEVDPEYYLDNTDPIWCIRDFPPIGVGANAQFQVAEYDGNPQVTRRFVPDIDCGNVPLVGGSPGQITLSKSDDRGHTWNPVGTQSIGAPGSYTTQPSWRALGSARDPRFSLSWSYPGPSALNGAWFESSLQEQ